MTEQDRDTTRRARVINNFIQKYGEEAFRDLIADFDADVAAVVTARRLGVSGERVRQWKQTFGDEVMTYTLHPEVHQLLRHNG